MAKQIIPVGMDSDISEYLEDLAYGNHYYNNGNLTTSEVILKIGVALTGLPEKEVYGVMLYPIGVSYSTFKQMVLREREDLGSKRFQSMAERPKFRAVYDCLMGTRDFYSIYGSVHGFWIKNNAKNPSGVKHDILDGMILSVGAAILGISAADIMDIIHGKYSGLIH